MDSMEMRRNAIVQLINEKETVSFAQIKKKFPNVSEMTLRTDLKALDEEKRSCVYTEGRNPCRSS